jgi:hypothetical protein
MSFSTSSKMPGDLDMTGTAGTAGQEKPNYGYSADHAAHRDAGPGAATTNPFFDQNGLDEFDYQMMLHREQLQSIENQIANIDVSIGLEQQKLRDAKAALDQSYRTRTRLLHLRTAMVKFVMDLQSQSTE